MYQELVHPFLSLCENADSFLISVNGYTCNPTNIQFTPFPKSFPYSENQRNELLSYQSFDHVISTDDSTSSSLPILYSSYKEDLLSWLSSLSNTPIILRPFHSTSTHPQPTTHLSGYGIAMDIKNTEYKVIDDRTSTGSNKRDTPISDIDMDIDGFNFPILKQRYPDLSSLLDDFKSSLVNDIPTVESISPLLLKDLGLKVIQFVAQSSNPLSQLNTIVSQFPKMAPTIARIPISDELRKETNKLLKQYGDSRGTVIMNNQQIQLSNNHFNFYSFLSMIRNSFNFINAQKQLNFTSADLQLLSSILQQQSISDETPVRFTLAIQTHSTIQWINDVSKDRQYRDYSTNLRRFYMAAISFPRVRSNFLNRVIILDPMNSRSMESLQMVYEMLQQVWPVHFGFWFTSPVLRDMVGHKNYEVKEIKQDDPIDAVQLLQLFMSIKETSNPLVSIIFLNNFLAESNHSIQSVLSMYFALTEHDGLTVLETGSYIDEITQMVRYLESIHLTEGNEMINGQVFSLLSFNEFIMQSFQEIQLIIKGIDSNDIKSVKDIPSYLVDHSQVIEEYDLQVFLPFNEQTFISIPSSIIFNQPILIQEGTLGVYLLYLPSLSFTSSLLPLLSSLSSLEHYSILLTTPDSTLLPLLLLLHQAYQHQFLESMNEVIICFNQSQDLQACSKLYLEDEEYSLLSFNDDSQLPLKNWNDQISSYFANLTKPALFVNGRLVIPISISEASITAVARMDEQYSISLHDAFPTISPSLLLPFIHSYYEELNMKLPSLPSSSPLLLSKQQPNSIISLTAIIDPLTIPSQRLISIFSAIQRIIPISYQILLLPQLDYSENPLKRFYSFVLQSDNSVLWRDLPSHYIYTMSTETPFKWNTVAYEAEADLDNIRFVTEDTVYNVEYIVDSIIIEGSCINDTKPASGVMLQSMKYGNNHIISDTVVMNNRGYWQLRGNMGLYTISISEESKGNVLINNKKEIEKDHYVSIY